MKKKILLLITSLSLSLLVGAQTLFVPTGTNGVGISANNNVGVGTSTPGAKLEVSGDIFGSLDNSVITIKDDNIGLVKKWADSGVWAVGYNYCHRFGRWSTASLIGNVSSGSFTEQMRIANNGYVGIGTTNPGSKLVIADGNNGVSINSGDVSGLGFNRNVSDGAIYNPNLSGWQFSARDERFSLEGYNGAAHNLLNVLKNGNVGIGTTNPDQKLTVKGKIHAEEIIIDLAVPADYVFKPNYKLMPLHQVEQFVKTNSHLPEIPSTNEITKNGLSMGEMQNKLLQKVEELTLYAIQQNKKIVEQEKKNNELELELNTLKKVVANEIAGRK